MHLGFATLETGLTRQKNTVNIIFKNLFIISIGIVSYALTGFNTMYPGDFMAMCQYWGRLWLHRRRCQPVSSIQSWLYLLGDFIFQAMFAATAATIVSGAVAERVKLSGFMLYAAILVAFAYALLVRGNGAAAGSMPRVLISPVHPSSPLRFLQLWPQLSY